MSFDRTVIYIEDVAMPTPAYQGYLIKRHLAWKYTITVEWKGLTAAEKTLLMTATGQISSDDVDKGMRVRFLDMDTDTFIERRMYRGTDQTISGYGPLDPVTNQFRYYDVKMSLIEL